MNYQQHYDNLILRAQQRVITEHTETHHIIPKCVGGQDTNDNLVKLTPEEHYTAHLLLVKIYKNIDTKAYKKLLYACNLMSGNSNIGRRNKYYGWIKRQLSEARKGSTHSNDIRIKISKKVKEYYELNSSHLKGTKLSKDHKAKCSKALSGRVLSKEHRNKIGEALRGKPKSLEHRKKFQGEKNPAYKPVTDSVKESIIAQFQIGYSISDIGTNHNLCSDKINRVLEQNQINPSIRTCPHCKKTGQTSNMLRWHFDNCKVKK